MTIKAVFFDVDGTLVDSNEAHVEAWHEAFGAEGFHLDKDAIRAQIGKGGDHLIPSLLPEADSATRERIDARHGGIFQHQFLARIRPFPRAQDLLRRVHAAGQLVLLASSAKGHEVAHYRELLDPDGIISHITSADDVERSKPAPDIFAAALNKVPLLTADEVIVVGDTPYDVIAAKSCGIAAVALRSGGFADDALTRAGAIAVYDDTADLLGDYESSPLSHEQSGRT